MSDSLRSPKGKIIRFEFGFRRLRYGWVNLWEAAFARGKVFSFPLVRSLVTKRSPGYCLFRYNSATIINKPILDVFSCNDGKQSQRVEIGVG